MPVLEPTVIVVDAMHIQQIEAEFSEEWQTALPENDDNLST